MQSKHFCKLGNNSVTTLATNPHRSTATAALKSSRRGSFVDESKRSPKMSKLGQVSLSLSLSLCRRTSIANSPFIIETRPVSNRSRGRRSIDGRPKVVFAKKKKNQTESEKQFRLRSNPFGFPEKVTTRLLPTSSTSWNCEPVFP